jgi:hypothetical protein
MQSLDFLFGGEVVGYFEEPTYPQHDGAYHYMPYRSPGHYKMGMEIREKGSARCEYFSAEQRMSFNVQVVEYGILQLSGFRSEQAT